MFKKTTVDTILASFTKTIKELEVHEVTMRVEQDRLNADAAAASAKAQAAGNEAAKAAAARYKLDNIFA